MILGLMIVYIILLLLLAVFLLRHLNRRFLIFDPVQSPQLQTLFRFTAGLLIVVAIAGIGILILGHDSKLNLITLLLGAGVVAIFAVALTHYEP
ncbi:hypothetical protein IV38_GL000215 [Lactobacillus selangorensis]|uniref:Integral membrane protein n=1 Tax=Lactobacillus selangorensis TaxID=81857 RepID=A0A0R2FWN0_9LACO|nr:hypothetical protein [Lactobacillus selangorensis]KRN29332.1 hypothetical protein IV38_GL000215 [Lactobacillus selangorensis]KRN34139.1 hypothetical protein IV40_GL000454 [Lactobacillus selangorensis]